LHPSDFIAKWFGSTLTERAAQEFAGLDQALRDRGYEARRVADFTNTEGMLMHDFSSESNGTQRISDA